VSTLRLILERQWIHVLALLILVPLVAWASRFESVRAGQVLGLDSVHWLWLAVGLAIGHQSFVWLCWRSELHASLLRRVFGRGGFVLYATVFGILIVTRGALVFVLAASNRGTIETASALLETAAVICLVPAVYLFYSVRRYYGFRRAFGIDHFDASYRSLPPVREGIFRFTPNGMYVFGFLLLWVPGLWSASAAALLAALFNHLYIWVHYFATERPDMRRIYGDTTT